MLPGLARWYYFAQRRKIWSFFARAAEWPVQATSSISSAPLLRTFPTAFETG